MTIDDLKRRVTMLTLNHGRAARLIGLGCAAMLTAGGLALAPQVRAQAPEPETKTFEKRIEIREVHGAASTQVASRLGFSPLDRAPSERRARVAPAVIEDTDLVSSSGRICNLSGNCHGFLVGHELH